MLPASKVLGIFMHGDLGPIEHRGLQGGREGDETLRVEGDHGWGLSAGWDVTVRVMVRGEPDQ